MREEGTKETAPFASFDFSEEEIIGIYAALQRYHQILAQSDDLDQSQRTINVMKRIRGAAVEAAKRIKERL